MVFDFAGRTLVPLLELPHTRAVVTADDLEATAREIEWLAEELPARQAMLGEARGGELGSGRGFPPGRGVLVVDRTATVVQVGA